MMDEATAIINMKLHDIETILHYPLVRVQRVIGGWNYVYYNSEEPPTPATAVFVPNGYNTYKERKMVE